MKRLVFTLAAVFALALTAGTSIATAQAAAAEPDGAALYRQHCRTCHGLKGVPTQRMMGLYPELKTLADSAFQAGLSVDSISAVVRRGAGRDMKPFADKMTPEEIAAVARFVKTLVAGADGAH